MAQMYISTDEREANALLGFGEVQNPDLTEFNIKLDKEIEARIGFNPMSSFDLDKTPMGLAMQMAAKLSTHGLLAAILTDDGTCERYSPYDLGEREKLVQISLRGEKAEPHIKDYPRLTPNYAIIRYANDPSRIRTFLKEFF